MLTPRLKSSIVAFGIALLALSASAAVVDQPHQQRPINEPRATAPLQGGTAAQSDKKEETIFDRLWALPTLYKNDEASFLNEFRIIGRVHLDEYNIDSDLGHDQDWIVRRLRLGAKAEFFERRLTAVVEVDFDPQNDTPFYRRLTDAYLAWKFSDAFKLTVGKHSARFTLDGSTSSNELLTIDRNNLSNNVWFPEEYLPGISLSGKVSQWVYLVGVYSGGSLSPEFGNFDAGNLGLVSVGYDFGKQLGVKKALLRGDYVYNQRDPESTFTRSLENVGSLVFVLDVGRWGLSTDVSRATGYAGQGDLFGFVAMPWFNITDKLQVVGRYTYINGDKANSLRFSRYESFVTSSRGDEYNEIYGGLNYYIYGHKLKIQTGLSFATMHDRAGDGGRYAGWNWTTALRMSW
jgi:phosphate-selective porin OprO/OprP